MAPASPKMSTNEEHGVGCSGRAAVHVLRNQRDVPRVLPACAWRGVAKWTGLLAPGWWPTLSGSSSPQPLAAMSCSGATSHGAEGDPQTAREFTPTVWLHLETGFQISTTVVLGL